MADEIPTPDEVVSQAGRLGEVPDWLSSLTSEDVEPAGAPLPTPVAPGGEGGNGGQPPEAPARVEPVPGDGGAEGGVEPGVEPVTAEAREGRGRLKLSERLKGLGERVGRLRERVQAAGARGNELGERVSQAAVRLAAKGRGNLGEWARQRVAAEVPAETAEQEAAADAAAKERAAQEAREAEEQRLREEKLARQQAEAEAEERRRQAAEAERQGIKDEAVREYQEKLAAEEEAKRQAEEQQRAEELRAAEEKAEAERQAAAEAEAARLEEMRAEAEARRQNYEKIKAEALDKNKTEQLVRGVVGRDADGQRSAGGMIEDASGVISRELADVTQKDIAIREGITQAQELMRQREEALNAEKSERLTALRTDAENRLQIPQMRGELERVNGDLERVNRELERYLDMPARLQKTYTAEITMLRAEKSGLAAKKGILEKSIRARGKEADKVVEAQTPEVESWHKAQLLQAGREVSDFVERLEGYDKADVTAWWEMETDTVAHEANLALDNLEKWTNLVSDPDGVAGKIAEVQARHDLAVAEAEVNLNIIDNRIADLTKIVEGHSQEEGVKEAREEFQKAQGLEKTSLPKLREIAAGYLEAAKEQRKAAAAKLRRVQRARKEAVNAARAEILPAELLEQEGVNYGGEMAVTSYEGEVTMVPLVDVVKGNRNRNKEVPRREAVTPVGRLAEFVVWGGEAMEPDENGNPVPIKVKGIFEREGMEFAARVEAQVQLARERLERKQEGGVEAEPTDVNERLARAFEKIETDVGEAANEVFEAAKAGRLGEITPENKKRLGELVGTMSNSRDGLVAKATETLQKGIANKTPEVQAELLAHAAAIEMLIDNAPAEAGALAGLRGIVGLLRQLGNA